MVITQIKKVIIMNLEYSSNKSDHVIHAVTNTDVELGSKQAKPVPFQAPSTEVRNPGKLQELKEKVMSLIWQGISIKNATWYPAVAEKHFAWMESIGGERMMLGGEGEKIDTMFFSTEDFVKRLKESGGKYATIKTDEEEHIHGFVFKKEEMAEHFIGKTLKGIEGRDQENYGFLDTGWEVQSFDNEVIVFPKQFNKEGEVTVHINSIEVLDQEPAFSTKNTVVISPGLLTLYEVYDDILGEVPAFLQQGINVVLFNYRGYGQSEGLPSEKAVDHDLELILQYLKEQKGITDENLILKGTCLGGGPVSRAALNHPQAKVILDQTFANTDTFIDTLVKKELSSLIPTDDLGDKKEYVERTIGAIGRQVFPHYNNYEKISNMKNELCLVINNSDELIPQMGKSGPDYDENKQNIASLPENLGQNVSIVFLESVRHAEGWYKNSTKNSVTNQGLSQMHDFLDKVGFSHDITAPTDSSSPKARPLTLIRQSEKIYQESAELLENITRLKKELTEEKSSILPILKFSSLEQKNTEMNHLIKKFEKLNNDIDKTINQIVEYQGTNSSELNKELDKRLTEDVSELKRVKDKITKKINRTDEVEISQDEEALKIFDLSQHSPKLMTNSGSVVTQIEVLNQASLSGGHETCGFHSWKNGLISLALSSMPPPQTELVDLFNDVNFFSNEVEPFLANFNSGGGDIPATALHEATNQLLQGKVDKQRYPILDRLATLLSANRENISFLNTAIEGQPLNPFDPSMGDWDKDAINGGGSHLVMNNIVNSIQALKNPGPLTHVFVSGTGGHWVTLIMQKDKNNQIKWYGTDSWENQTKALPNHQSILQKIVQDPNFEAEIIRNEYTSVISSDIGKLAKKLDANGDPLPPLNLSQVAESFEEVLLNINRIIAATKYLKDLKLYKDPNYSTEVSELKKSALFYQNYLNKIPDVRNLKGVQNFFSTYDPYTKFDSNYFENNEISSPLLKSIPILSEVSAMSVDDLMPLEKQFEKLNKNDGSFSPIEYSKVLEKFFDKSGLELKRKLKALGLISNDLNINSKIIEELTLAVSAEQMSKIRTAIKEIHQKRLKDFIIKYGMNGKIGVLPEDLNKALALVKRTVLQENQAKLQIAINQDQEKVKNELISKRQELLDLFET